MGAMKIRTHRAFLLSFLLGIPIILDAAPIEKGETQREYFLEAYREERNGENPGLILRIVPLNNERLGRQEEDGGSRPFIPAVIPAVTKIISGVLSGNLNEIFHGSTAFAPQEVSYVIDTVYNQVVGLPPPTSTTPINFGLADTTPAPAPAATSTPQSAPTPAPTRRPVEAPTTYASFSEAERERPALPDSPSFSIAPGQPLSQSIIITSTPKATILHEDDEDESDVASKLQKLQ